MITHTSVREQLLGRALRLRIRSSERSLFYRTQTCDKNGNASSCVGVVGPAKVDCASSNDNDCNGNPDSKDCGCKLGHLRSCYSGLTVTKGVGACKAGTQSCVQNPENGNQTTWGDCVGEVLPAPNDTCDRSNDDSCDGHDKTGCDCLNGDTASCAECSYAAGDCSHGTSPCSAGKWQP